MKRVIALAFTVALAIAVVPAGSIRAAGPEKDKPADEATALAVKLTEQGAATFDTFNAKAMADYYLEDAEIALVTREEGGLKVQTYKGRAEIEKAMPTSSRSPRRSSRRIPSSTPS